MTPPPALLFDTPEQPPAARRALAERVQARFPGSFPDTEAAMDWLRHTYLPADLSWAYVGNAKTGTTSTKEFLHFLHFGRPISARYEPPVDINPDAVGHMLQHAGIFRPALSIPAGMAAVERAFRFTTARHPTTRALSSFRYLCQADAAASAWLLPERLRMTAQTGMDWARDAGTPRGFECFLDYLTHAPEGPDRRRIDRHLRPQVTSVVPAAARPNLIGRTEALGDFFHALAERLDRPLPPGWQPPHQNASGQFSDETLLTPLARKLLARAFAADYDWLQEDVDSWRAPPHPPS